MCTEHLLVQLKNTEQVSFIKSSQAIHCLKFEIWKDDCKHIKHIKYHTTLHRYCFSIQLFWSSCQLYINYYLEFRKRQVCIYNLKSIKMPIFHTWSTIVLLLSIEDMHSVFSCRVRCYKNDSSPFWVCNMFPGKLCRVTITCPRYLFPVQFRSISVWSFLFVKSICIVHITQAEPCSEPYSNPEGGLEEGQKER